MTLDVAALRRQTPGCAHVTHFNNAGAALMPRPVLDAVIDHLRLESEIGGYEAQARERERIEGVYASAAALIHAAPEEIAIAESATRAWEMAFYAIPLKPGDRVLTGVAEYASNYLAMLQVSRRTGAEIVVIPDDEHGQISLEALERALDERVKVVALTHVPTSGGLVNPAAEVGRIARGTGAVYLLDACQSAGQMPLDVEALGCDVLTAASRKYLRGPRGLAFLYVRRTLVETLEPPLIDNHAARLTGLHGYAWRDDARRFEHWERNVAGVLGLGAAIDYARGVGLEGIWERVRMLGERLRSALSELPGVAVRDAGAVRCGIVTFTVEGVAAGEVRRSLGDRRINVSTALRAETRLDMETRGLPDLVRASVHYYNTEEELASLVQGVTALGGR